jgi:hypothetical protein
MQRELTRDIWNEVIAKPHMSPTMVKIIVERYLGREEKTPTLKPFTIGQAYTTKFQTKETFKITDIKYKWDKDLGKNVPHYFSGILSGKEHLGEILLNMDRLLQKQY